MVKVAKQVVLALAGVLTTAAVAEAQVRPYIGFVYPAGGRQGTTFLVKLGGQNMDDLSGAVVTGPGVTAKVVEHRKALGPQDIQLLNEQLRDLRKANPRLSAVKVPAMDGDAMMNPAGMMDAPSGAAAPATADANPVAVLMGRIQRRVTEYVQRPACQSIASIAMVEVKIAADAPPGQRELRLLTPRGISNPMVFNVGQLPESCRAPMLTAHFQVLGKEELALRKRPPEEIERRVELPCTVNGQVASGEVNQYRFTARKGQRLVLSVQARQLIPYIADAVPGWFQPVLVLYDGNMKELAYDDDFRFKPDPTIFFEAPKDGEYVCAIYDGLYRGREDFVYRLTMGELPYLTSIFPLGAPVGADVKITMKGWNLKGAKLTPPDKNAPAGIGAVGAVSQGFSTNRVPFARDTLPETLEQDDNNTIAAAQKVKLPIIINGRIDRPGDWDVYQFTGKAGQTVVAEVSARRLDSPLDSVLKLTDAKGKLLAFNDDEDDPAAGVNTHHADSYLSVKLPTDGTYYVHLGDTDHQGGEEYAYRLRISPPQPDFALRVVPSSLGFRGRSGNAVTVYALRKDGFTGPIKVALKNPPQGFACYPMTINPNQEMVRLGVKAERTGSEEAVALTIEGRAKIGDREIAHEAVPAEDRMQAFLWRHLVPAQSLVANVFDPTKEIPPKRVLKEKPEAKPADTAKTAPAGKDAAEEKPKAKFTKNQVAGRLRQLKLLFEEGLLTDDFYEDKVAECEAAR